MLFVPVLMLAAYACGDDGPVSHVGGKGGSGGSGGSGGKTSGSGGKAPGSGGKGASAGSGGSGVKGGSGGGIPDTAGMGGAGNMGGSGAAGGTGPGCQDAPVDLTNGLIGHWQFEEGNGITIADSSGKNNVGKVVEGGTSSSADHAAPKWAQGKKGMGLNLDGTDDWIRVEDSDSLDSTGINNGVSMTGWAKIDKINASKDYNFLIIRHEIGTRLEHFGLGMFQGLPVVNVHFFKAIGPENVPIGEWVHMAATYDGITARVFINGAEVSFLDVGWPIAADETPLTIGAGINEEDVIEHLAGTLDETRLYNRELTPCEVQETMK